MFKYVYISLSLIFTNNLQAFDIMESVKTNEYLVMQKLEVKNEPVTNGMTLITLGVCDEIKMLSVTNIDKEKWVFIDSKRRTVEQKDYIKGWVQKNSIVQISQFKKVKKIKEYYIKGWSGDYEFGIQIYANGKYVLCHNDDNNQFVYDKGQLYKYNNMLIAGWEYLFFDEDGVLNSWASDEDGNHFQSKTNRGPFYKKFKGRK